MLKVRYEPLGPLLSGIGSHAVLALEIPEAAPLEARPAVLVWLPREAQQDPELIATVERETRRAAQLEHPNILRVYGLIARAEGRARAVEYADGETLRRVLEVAKKIPASLAALIAADAATGAHYAHLAGNDDGTPLVHADLRPETLLLSFSGFTKVSGYGALAVAPKEPDGRRVLGRRTHCAPEQILGGRSAVNVQTDVYLLGVGLYEMITGLVPFEEEKAFDQAVLGTPLPAISEDLCPAPLSAVIHKAMSKRASDRYASTLVLREAIERAVGGVLPSHEDLAKYLHELFPDDDPARVSRRQLLEEGLRKLVASTPPRPPPVRIGLGEDQTNIPTQMMSAVAPKAAPKAAETRPPLAAAVPVVVAKAAPQKPAQKKGRGAGLALTVVAVIVIVGGVGVWREVPEARSRVRSLLGGASVPIPVAVNSNNPIEIAVVPPATASLDASVASNSAMDASVAVAAMAPEDAGTPSTVANADASAHGTVESARFSTAQGSLQLIVDPPVEVAIDGKPAGHTPFTVSVPLGKHLLHFTNKTKGINISRTVVVAEHAAPAQHIYLHQGYFTVIAPAGAEIFVDGRMVGKAPQREIGVYEGSHKLVVNANGAKWQESFEAKPNQRTTFTVNFR